MFERYAVYFAPEPQTPLARFAAAWFGPDAPLASRHTPRETFGLPQDVHTRAIQRPARYGLHATLKAPFRLVTGTSERRLANDVATIAARTTAITTPPLQVGRMDGFVALLCEGTGGEAELAGLAETCVTELDSHRAPLDDSDRARRSPERLSPGQREHLERWGYPNVLDRFRFHLTLTGQLDEGDATAVENTLADRLKNVTEHPFTLSSLCLFGDPGPGRPFMLLDRFPLKT